MHWRSKTAFVALCGLLMVTGCANQRVNQNTVNGAGGFAGNGFGNGMGGTERAGAAVPGGTGDRGSRTPGPQGRFGELPRGIDGVPNVQGDTQPRNGNTGQRTAP